MTSMRGLWVVGISLVMMAGRQEQSRADPLKAVPTRAGPGEPSKTALAAVAPPEQKTATSAAVTPPDNKIAPDDGKNAPVVGSPSEQRIEPKAAPAAWPAADQLSSALLRGPSMYETGRVGKMGVAEAGLQIHQTHSRTDLQEQRIEGRTAKATALPAADSGAIDPVIMRREMRPKFALLRECRGEVARQKKIAASSVTASELTLRWTILDDGRVSQTQVVATARVDNKVMSCVKRQMSQWSFSAPGSGPVRVESPFKF
jgi:hypothetical protein